jgi:hypothetical protein
VGAWGAGVFENDSALDWVAELAERGGIEPVVEALERATASADGYLDADDGSMALAAAEAVAASKGAPTDDLPAEVEAWAEANAAGIGAANVAASLAAVERVGGTDSELADLWEESGSAGEWREHLESLRVRLER